jgi:hypothetical protein
LYPALENLITDIAIMVYSMFNENVYKDSHQFTGNSAIFKKKKTIYRVPSDSKGRNNCDSCGEERFAVYIYCY